MHTTAHVLTVLGIIGIVDFLLVALCARQLATTTVPRLRRRVDAPLVHFAPALAGVSVAVTLAGVLLTAQ